MAKASAEGRNRVAAALAHGNKQRGINKRRTKTGHIKMPPCFDQACRDVRDKLQGMLNRGEGHMPTYKRLRAKQRNLYHARRRKFQQKRHNDILEQLRQYPKRFWANLQEHKEELKLCDVEVWLEYGKKLYDTVGAGPPEQQSLASDDGKTRFTDKLVKTAIGQMQWGKSGDSTGITAEIFKALKNTTLVSVLTRLFNKILTEGQLPMEWGRSTAVRLFKAGDPELPGNYCTIMINAILHKLMAKCCDNMLRAGKYHEKAVTQAAFRTGHSCADHIFMLRAVIQVMKARKRVLHTCFVDLRKAFDIVPRGKLWNTLLRVFHSFQEGNYGTPSRI